MSDNDIQGDAGYVVFEMNATEQKSALVMKTAAVGHGLTDGFINSLSATHPDTSLVTIAGEILVDESHTVVYTPERIVLIPHHRVVLISLARDGLADA